MSWWTALCGDAPEGQRPGGLPLTERAAGLSGISGESRVLDVGCGRGETLRFLRERCGCEALGVEADASLCADGVIHARAEKLPFEAASFDGVLLECTLSQIEDADAALAECARVLRPGGRLIVSDLYARDGGEHTKSAMGRVESRAALAERFSRAGFREALFEDQSEALVSLWAGAMLSGGEDACALLRANRAEDLKPGYYLWIGEKSE